MNLVAGGLIAQSSSNSQRTAIRLTDYFTSALGLVRMLKLLSTVLRVPRQPARLTAPGQSFSVHRYYKETRKIEAKPERRQEDQSRLYEQRIGGILKRTRFNDEGSVVKRRRRALHHEVQNRS